MSRSAVMQPAVWNAGYATLMFFMWWLMMVAMMLPSASPMVLLFAVVNRKQRDQGNPFRTPGAMRSSPGTGAPVPGGALRMG
ncbi:MAG TPA: hypothetical protein EYM39_07920, partial [Candidatus Latescibacteria bacterium]|nr:hypothetical protein [Candidatus Latescibacterota bacterium]